MEIRHVESGAGPVCRAILDALPEWFGIPEANDDYIDHADRTPCLVASDGGRDIGILVPVRHFPTAAEVHLIAVVPDRHRSGVGRALLHRLEETLAADGVEFLQVKTLAPEREDPNYELTRLFYEANGFRPLEVFPTLWDPSNPALQLVKALPVRRTLDDLLEAARRDLDRVEPQALAAEIHAGAVVVDTRPESFRKAEGELPGAVVIERNVLEWRLDPTSVDRIAEATGDDVRVIVVCNEGYASSFAAADLRRLGLHRATDLVGGYRAWRVLQQEGSGAPLRPR